MMSKSKPIPRIPLWTWIVGAAVLIPSILGFANKFLDLIIIAQGDEEGAFALTPMINYLLATAGFFCMLMYAVAQGRFTTSMHQAIRCLRTSWNWTDSPPTPECCLTASP